MNHIYLLLIISSLIIIFLSLLYLDKNYKLKEYSINMNTTINEDLFSLLDKFINEQFTSYILFNAYENLDFIKADIETKINTDVSFNVIKNISPVLKLKISTIYNMKYFTDIVTKKVYLRTLNFVLEKNKIKKKRDIP